MEARGGHQTHSPSRGRTADRRMVDEVRRGRSEEITPTSVCYTSGLPERPTRYPCAKPTTTTKVSPSCVEASPALLSDIPAAVRPGVVRLALRSSQLRERAIWAS